MSLWPRQRRPLQNGPLPIDQHSVLHNLRENLSLTYPCPSWGSCQCTVRLYAFGGVVDLAIRTIVAREPRIVSTAVGQFTGSISIQHHHREDARPFSLSAFQSKERVQQWLRNIPTVYFLGVLCGSRSGLVAEAPRATNSNLLFGRFHTSLR